MKNRLTPQDIENMIDTWVFLRSPGSTLTVCELKLTNGCTLVGTSNVIDPNNFSSEIGEKVALENAKGKIWEAEGYAIKRDMISLVRKAAAAGHEVNRVYCASQGDMSQLPWNEAPDWQKESAIAGAMAIAMNPDQSPEMSHESWLAHKKADGWVWGPVKDPETKEHPCMVPYAELPEHQKAKDAFFTAVVKAVLN